MWDRRQIRAVGLDQQTVGRAGSRGLADGRCALEGDDAREAEEAAAVEGPPGLVGSAGEAVEHELWRYPGLVEHGERVVPCVAGMHDERQRRIDGELDLGGEHVSLHI